MIFTILGVYKKVDKIILWSPNGFTARATKHGTLLN